jgi:hypothetical protein
MFIGFLRHQGGIRRTNGRMASLLPNTTSCLYQKYRSARGISRKLLPGTFGFRYGLYDVMLLIVSESGELYAGQPARVVHEAIPNETGLLRDSFVAMMELASLLENVKVSQNVACLNARPRIRCGHKLGPQTKASIQEKNRP